MVNLALTILLLFSVKAFGGYTVWYDDSQPRVVYIEYPYIPITYTSYTDSNGLVKWKENDSRWFNGKVTIYTYPQWLQELRKNWLKKYDFREFSQLSIYWKGESVVQNTTYYAIKDSGEKTKLHLYMDCQYLKNKEVVEVNELGGRDVCLTCLARKAEEEK